MKAVTAKKVTQVLMDEVSRLQSPTLNPTGFAKWRVLGDREAVVRVVLHLIGE